MITESLNGKQWTAPDEFATENETRDFVYGLVRLVKPMVVVETGCYQGGMTAILCAVAWPGYVFSCDTNEECVEAARQVAPSSPFILKMTGVALIEQIPMPIDFAFLDSGGDRLEEAQALLPKLSAGAYVVIHDSRRPNEQAALAYLQEHAKTELLTFDTPRGCAVVRVWR